jgi:hypothetical protein
VTGVHPGGAAVDVDLARDWVSSQIALLGGTLTEEGTADRNRAWSHTTLFGTTLGRVWFKANARGTAHEPRLHRLLARLVPDLLPGLLAVDEARSWSLLTDAGPTLRTLAAPDAQLATWEQLLPRYAQAQLTVAAHRDDLVRAGVPERSPTTLPAQAGALVAQLATLAEDRGGLGPDRRAALEARMATYGRWCAELSASGLPDTIQHDDLHSANVCVDGASVRILDWGDASLGHPFGTMLVTLNSLAHHAGLDLRDPPVLRVRDAYLDPFTAYADRRDLVHLVDRARQVGRVTRALAWRAALSTEPPEAHAEWDFPVRGWLEEIAQD